MNLMDDIDDNSFFYDLIERRFPPTSTATATELENPAAAGWRIFEFRGRHVGMIGRIARAQ